MARRGLVVVVGLGPAGAELLFPAARDALRKAPRRFVRTAKHPAVADLQRDGITLEPFDEIYEKGTDLDAVYHEIVDTLVAAASQHGVVAYAVPGNPAVAERTVALLRDAARHGAIAIRFVPGLSFADLVWAYLGVDPVEGARVVDGRELRPEVLDEGRPLLVAQCDSRFVLSDVKLALLERLPPAAPVTVLQRLCLPDERVVTIPLEELDRAIEPDHLTAVYVDAPVASAGGAFATLLALAERLRAPDGCPWDAEQTHHSLTRYLLEEAYEVVEAVEQLPASAPDDVAADDPRYAALADELGDLLYQVVFHAVLAQEAGAFTMADVVRGIHDKLVRRHPHVFGDVEADSSAAVMANWEQIKKEERGSESVLDGLTPGLPSLLYAHKLLRKAAALGLDPGDAPAALDRIDAAGAALRAGAGDLEAGLGELLAAVVALARAGGVDAESALRGWAARFRAEVEQVEQGTGP